MGGEDQPLPRVGLHERESLLAEVLDAQRRAHEGQGAAVVLVGEAGVGKTSLIDVLATRLRAEGAAVLQATCSPLEVDFPFAAARQLLRSSTPHGDPFTALDALYWSVAAKAEEGPVVLLLDDVHWADDPSLRWLHFLLHRLPGLPVLPLLATRPHGLERPLLAGVTALPVVRQVFVPPLSAPAARRLLEERSRRQLPAGLVDACYDATGGNPFYLTALALAVREQGADRLEVALADHIEPLPQRVSRAVLDRLRALGPDAVAVARAVAVLGGEAQPAEVAALAGLSEQRAAGAIRAAQEAGLLRAGHPLTAQHPIVMDAIYEDVPVQERTRLHKEAARQLAGAGAEPERVALHLVATTPADDIWVVESLLTGARSAVARGAPETACRYLRRALAEPLARGSAVLLLELGGAELLAGDLAAAERLREALAVAQDDATIAAAATLLSRALVYVGDVPQAVEVLLDAAARLADPRGELAVRVELEAVNAARLDARTVQRGDALLVPYAGWSGDRPVDRLVQAHLSVEPARTGRSAAEAVALARLSLADGVLLAEQGAEGQSYYLPVIALLLSDALEDARTHLDAALAQARERGSVLGVALASAWRSHMALRAGDVRAAGADAEAALAAAGSAELPVLTPYGTAFLSDALVELGDLDAADALWRERGLDGPLPPVLPSNYLLFSRGVLRLAQGRPADALTDLRESAARQQQWCAPGPGFWPWASRAALALDLLGEPAQAQALVEQELRAAREFGALRPLGMALHARALLARGAERITGLEQARDTLEASPARLEHARACVDLGAALVRRARHAEGVARLEDGLRRAGACGATALARRARAELLAAGVAPRRVVLEGVDALTISERRVAQLAAEGRTNRAIAQELFVTPKTVETHLARAFRKLGVTSRRELAGVPAFADPTPPGPA